MAQELCPKCSKRVEFGEDGKCPNCGYINTRGDEMSPFARSNEEPAVSYDDKDEEETSGSTPVVTLDAETKRHMTPVDQVPEKPKLLLGIGLSRIFAYFSAILVIISAFVPYTVFILKVTGEADDSEGLTLFESLTPSVYVMLLACLVALFFAFRGKPAGYLLCTVIAAVCSALNYVLTDSAVDVVNITTNSVIRKYASENAGIILSNHHGAGFYLMIAGIVFMIIAASVFLKNHRAYDD
ncbi:MAG: hypothetical protein J5777_00175 [Clostridiales bacterium]|nr:hypothetical protein [Clostridiales bacterium]